MSETGTANLYSQGSRASAAAPIQERGQDNVRRVGRSNFAKSNNLLYPGIDVNRALQRDVPTSFTMDRLMSPSEAGTMVTSILNSCGMSNEDDAYMYAFIKSMLLCMAANSASTLVPGRAKFYVADSEFDFFTDVMAILGNDARRFFRAYADATKEHLKDLQAEVKFGPRSQDEDDVKRFESASLQWHYITLVAQDRGLTRIPYMVHDSSECCSNKTSVELVHLASCKATMFANGEYQKNLVDNPVVSRTKGGYSGRDGPVVSSSNNNSSMPEGF